MIALALLGLLACAPLQTSPVRAPVSGLRADGACKKPPKPPTNYAVLVNGGGEPSANYSSHLVHLQETRAALIQRGFAPEAIAIFDSDGGAPAPDQLAAPASDEGQWLLVGTEYEDLLKPQPRDSSWEVPRFPATQDALGRWLGSTRFREGDTLLFYVTDHGSEEALSLWQEELTPTDLSSLLDKIPRATPTMLVMNQCFAGVFQDVLAPDSNRCALYAVPADREAYGCYPSDGTQREGHAFALVDALPMAESWSAARDLVSLSDGAPDVPLMSSDVYLSEVISNDELGRMLAQLGITDLRVARSELLPMQALGRRFSLDSVESLSWVIADGTNEEASAVEAGMIVEDWLKLLGAANTLNAAKLAPDTERSVDVVQAALQAQARADGTWPVIQATIARVEASFAAQMAHSARGAARQRQLVELRRVAATAAEAPVQERLGALRACESRAIGSTPAASTPSATPAPMERPSLVPRPNIFGLEVEEDRVTGVKPSSVAALAGLAVGDRLLQVDDTADVAWFGLALALHPSRVRFERKGVTRTLSFEWEDPT